MDDDPDTLKVIKMGLERNGFSKVDTFTDPVLALLNFTPGKYDIAILDVIMPALNGVELYKKLKEIDENIRACLLTGTGQHDFQVAFPSFFPECFMTKPVTIPELVKKIKEILEPS